MRKCKSKEPQKANSVWEESCGNVYKDLGFSDDQAANLAVRSQLMVAVKDVIQSNKWSQEESMQQLEIDREQLTQLLEGHVGKLSVDLLMSWLHKLGKEVTVDIRDYVA